MKKINPDKKNNGKKTWLQSLVIYPQKMCTDYFNIPNFERTKNFCSEFRLESQNIP